MIKDVKYRSNTPEILSNTERTDHPPISPAKLFFSAFIVLYSNSTVLFRCGKPKSTSILTNVGKYVGDFIQPIIDGHAEFRANLQRLYRIGA